MTTHLLKTFPFNLLLIILVFWGCNRITKEIERPEKIVSKRQVVYDVDTYKNLAELWKRYYREFPSEYAYANWMYAARYATNPHYESLLEKGVKKYPANPVLLYLYSMTEHGGHSDLKAQHLLEKALRLDPSYIDPWFSLVIHYMDREPEKIDFALRKILESGAISEEIMDYSYNMLACLEKNAILITNGDNDTYPGWILTRLVKHRPDVIIVNRSMLNTDWYPFVLNQEGLPRFITENELKKLHEEILNDYKTRNISIPSYGPFSDTLIVRIIESVSREGRPVYFAATLFQSEVINRYNKQGQNLGLVTLVTPIDKPYSTQIRELVGTWINEFRTGGLDSWKLRYSKTADAGRKLMINYVVSIHFLLNEANEYIHEYRLELFRWYQKHLLEIVPSKDLDEMNKMWCRIKDIKEIQDWCRNQGYFE